jgi:hypothetical protein
MNTAQTVQPTDILTFRFISAYLVEGLQPPVGGPQVIHSNAAQGKKVLLTDHSYEGFDHICAVHTIAKIILTSMFQGKIWHFNQFRTYVSTTAQERRQHYGPNAAFLVVEASHEEEASCVGTIGESDLRDFCLALPNGFRDAVEIRHKAFLEKSKAFLSFGMPSVVGLLDAGSCILANHPSGKPLYILTSSMSARPTLSAPIAANSLEGLEAFFTDTESLNFESVMKLSADSISNRRDNLRAFLFAFTALDAFLRAFFKQHKQVLLLHRKAGLSPAVQKYAEEIEQRREQQGRTEDDYPIAYKFALSASYLGCRNLDQTVDEFGELTKTHRIALTHGYDFDEAALPTAKVRELLGELMRLQVARQDPQA